jgi:hypothetical protein
MASRSRLSRTTVSMRAIAASTRLVSALVAARVLVEEPAPARALPDGREDGLEIALHRRLGRDRG